MTALRDEASLATGVGLAFLLWCIVFLTGILGSFWLRVTFATAALAFYASFFGVAPSGDLKLDRPTLVRGVLSGGLLYSVFHIGFSVFRPFVEQGAASVYLLGGGSKPYFAAPVLVFTSVCEEYFWRRYVQRSLVARRGKKKGLILSTLAYALIHLPTLNAPLVFAALVAGLYWGVLYEHTGSFGTIAVSHIVWTELIFVFLPLS